MRCYPHFTLTRGRSPGFGSMTANSLALFRLAFASAPALRLNLAGRHHSPVHSTKGTPSHLSDASTDCKHTVSGSLSLRSRGPFHLSLTVLFSIGRQGVFSLRRWSSQIPTGFLVSRGTWGQTTKSRSFRVRDSHPLRSAFPCRSSTNCVFLLCGRFAALPPFAPLHRSCNPCMVSRMSGLGSSAFARHYWRNHSCFLFLGVLRCFSSPGCLYKPMDSACSPDPSRSGGSPIRIPADRSSLTAPRSISVFAPSFFGSWRLGILRALFLPSPLNLHTCTSRNRSTLCFLCSYPCFFRSNRIFSLFGCQGTEPSSPSPLGERKTLP